MSQQDTPSLTILSGPQSGSRLPLEDETLIGSDPVCQALIPSASPIQARICREDVGYVLYDTHSTEGVWLNDDRVAGRAVIQDGDVIWLGAPGEPTSIMIQCYTRGEGRLAPAPAATVDADFFVGEDPAAGVSSLVDEPAVETVAPPGPASGIFFVDSVSSPPPPLPPPSPSWSAPPDEGEPAAEPEPYVQAEEVGESEGSTITLEVDSAITRAARAERLPEVPPPSPPSTGPGSEEEPFFLAESPEAFAPVPPLFPDMGSEPELPVPAPAPVAAFAPPPPVPPPVSLDLPTETPQPALFAEPTFVLESEVPAPPSPPPTRPEVRPEVRPPAPTRTAPAGGSGAAPSPRPSPSPRPRTPVASVPVRGPAGQRPAVRSRGLRTSYLLVAVGVLGLAAVAAVAVNVLRAPTVSDVSPDRARIGETITVTGQHLGGTPAEDEVLFGDVPGAVVKASPTEIKVVVPEMRLLAGEDTALSLKVQVRGRAAAPIGITIYDAPRIARLEPDVAMPGEEIDIEGSGWRSDNVRVTFGTAPGQVLTAAADRLRVRVPPLDLAEGARVPVVVGTGADASAPGVLLVGHLPLVTEIVPPQAAVGDLLHVKGKGFSPSSENRVRIAGQPALVVGAEAEEIQVVVPHLPATALGSTVPLEVEVTGLPSVGRATLAVLAGTDPVDLRFTAEPFTDAAGHEYATVGTELGPAFVLSASGDRSAAQRAREAQEQWNTAAARLRASLDEQIEARGLDAGHPVIALHGRSQVLMEVTDEDAAAYSAGWTKGGGKEPVTAARLALWWQAVARDLVLVLVRGQAPENTPSHCPEGRLLAQIQERARKTGRFGLPREVLDGLKPGERDALRGLALRVPASIRSAEGGSATPTPSRVDLAGTWMGWETAGARRRSIVVTFDKGRGTLTYSGGVSLGVPLFDIAQPSPTSVRFTSQVGVGNRYYVGEWDGQKLSGTITQEGRDARTPVGTFELSR